MLSYSYVTLNFIRHGSRQVEVSWTSILIHFETDSSRLRHATSHHINNPPGHVPSSWPAQNPPIVTSTGEPGLRDGRLMPSICRPADQSIDSSPSSKQVDPRGCVEQKDRSLDAPITRWVRNACPAVRCSRTLPRLSGPAVSP